MSFSIRIVLILSAYVLVTQAIVPEGKDMQEQIKLLKDLVKKALKERHLTQTDSHSNDTVTEMPPDDHATESTATGSSDEQMYLHPQDFALKTWTEQALEQDFPSLVKYTMLSVRLDMVASAVQHISQFYIEHLSLLDNVGCVYTTELVGSLRYILHDSISRDLERHVVEYIAHAILHQDKFETKECYSVVQTEMPGKKLYQSMYAGFFKLIEEAEKLITSYSVFGMDAKQTYNMVFKNSEFLLVDERVGVVTADKETLHILSFVYRWLEALKMSIRSDQHVKRSDFNCSAITEELSHLVDTAVIGLQDTLSSRTTLKSLVEEALGPKCSSLAQVVTEDLLKNIKQWILPLDILRKIKYELDRLPENDMNPVVRFAWLTFLDMEMKLHKRETYHEHKILMEIERMTPVSLKTPLVSVYFEHLEEIMMVITNEIEGQFADFCLDHKLLAPLVGLLYRKGLDFTMANVHIANIAYKMWQHLKATYSPLQESDKFTLFEKYQEILQKHYQMKVDSNLKVLDQTLVGAPTANIFMEIAVLPGQGTSTTTLEELLHRVISTIVPRFFQSYKCSHVHNKFANASTLIKYFLESVERLDHDVVASVPELLSVLPVKVSLNLTEQIKNTLRYGLKVEIPHLFNEIHIIAAQLHTNHADARHIMSTFIAEKISYILYTEIRKISFTPIPQPLPSVDINEKLRSMAAWQHDIIIKFLNTYIDGLQSRVLNPDMSEYMHLENHEGQ